MKLLNRTDYIGGADASALLGRHLYRTRRSVWLAKRGQTPDLDLSNNPHVIRGEFMEPYVERYLREKVDPTINSIYNWEKHDAYLKHAIRGQRRIPQRADDAQIMLLDTDHPHPITGMPFIGGHPDAVGDEVLYEIKCPTSYKLDRISREGVPTEWTFQLQHYMLMTKLPKGCIVIWDADKWEPYMVWQEPDFNLQEIMLREYEVFWNHVLDGSEPCDGTPVFEDQVKVISDERVEALLKEYKEAYTQRYAAEDAQKAARISLLTYAQGRSALITPSYTATIQEVKMYGKMVTRLTVTESPQCVT